MVFGICGEPLIFGTVFMSWLSVLEAEVESLLSLLLNRSVVLFNKFYLTRFLWPIWLLNFFFECDSLLEIDGAFWL
jgi:hypothetical protein